jgi:hypothetical protein
MKLTIFSLGIALREIKAFAYLDVPTNLFGTIHTFV